jgi:hypothetical protein
MDGTTAPTVKLYVNTTGGNGTSAKLIPAGAPAKLIFLAVLPFSMMGMLLIGKRRGIWLALSLAVLCLALGLVGCGSGSASSTTSGALAPGSYQVILTATSNSTTPVTHSSTLSLVVNKK